MTDYECIKAVVKEAVTEALDERAKSKAFSAENKPLLASEQLQALIKKTETSGMDGKETIIILDGMEGADIESFRERIKTQNGD